MIAIDNVLVSDDIVEAKFVCDLNKCKGGCCEDGDAGGLFGVLRGLFGCCGGIDAVLRAEGDGGEDVFDRFGVGDVD